MINIRKNNIPVPILQVVTDVSMVMATVGSTSVDHNRLQFINALFRVGCLSSTHAVRILVQIRAHVELKRVFKSVVNLLAFPRLVVEVNSVKTESKHRWQTANPNALKLGRLSLTGLALDPVKFLKAEKLLERLLHAILALDRQHQVEKPFRPFA